ncbi:hypothetical protein [Sphingopyxis sp. KK2]|uniref:hypothetical protein n=1 Tax=Sphingopyxis sp. KK2 TaxID=1855727 RepID=UPI0011818CDE|nr:hypothetical protein [Sphingopyxis sp. KK2]
MALLALTAPSADDIQALEVTRVIGPYVDQTRDGRLYAEFAPDVETRGAMCEPVAGGSHDCRYEVRTKSFFDNAFGQWQPMSVRLRWKNGRWRVVDPGK